MVKRMRSRSIIGIILLLSFLGCKSPDNLQIGTYETVEIGKIEFGFRYVFQHVRGYLCSIRSLKLEADSSFELLNLPFISSGTWSYNNDSLILKIEESYWVNDSIKSKYPPDKIPEIFLKPISFRVNGENLLRLRPVGNDQKAIVKLKLIKPGIIKGD